MLKFISSKKKKIFDGFREKLSPLFYYSILSSPQKEKIKKERRKIQSINVSHCFIIPLCVFSSKQKKEKEKEKFNQSTSRAGRNKVLCELCQRGRYAQENSRPQIRHSCIHIHVAIYLLQPKWYQNLAVIIEQKSQKNIARASMKGSYVKVCGPIKLVGVTKVVDFRRWLDHYSNRIFWTWNAFTLGDKRFFSGLESSQSVWRGKWQK